MGKIVWSSPEQKVNILANDNNCNHDDDGDDIDYVHKNVDDTDNADDEDISDNNFTVTLPTVTSTSIETFTAATPMTM